MNNCLSCAENRGSLPDCFCPAGTYDDGKCNICNKKCLTCTAQNSCIVCAADRNITDTCNCPDGYYSDSSEIC